MHGPAAEALSCVLVAVVLATAITRPRWLPEAAAAVAAAAPVILTGVLPCSPRLGLLTVPAGLVLVTVALWAVLRI